MNDEQIIERCKAAGIKWIPPQEDEDDSGAFPGMFDMVTMSEMRALLAASASAEPKGYEAAMNFACYLIDRCEGETVSEEAIQRWLSAMIREPLYAPRPIEAPDNSQAVALSARITQLQNALETALEFIADATITEGQWHWVEEARAALSAPASMSAENRNTPRRSLEVMQAVSNLNSKHVSVGAENRPAQDDVRDDLESLLDDVTAIDTWYRGSPSYEHDAGWFKDRVVRLIEERITAIASPSAKEPR